MFNQRRRTIGRSGRFANNSINQIKKPEPKGRQDLFKRLCKVYRQTAQQFKGEKFELADHKHYFNSVMDIAKNIMEETTKKLASQNVTFISREEFVDEVLYHVAGTDVFSPKEGEEEESKPKAPLKVDVGVTAEPLDANSGAGMQRRMGNPESPLFQDIEGEKGEDRVNFDFGFDDDGDDIDSDYDNAKVETYRRRRQRC